MEGLTMDHISRLLFVTESPSKRIALVTTDELQIIYIYQDKEGQPVSIACDYINGWALV